MNETQLIRAQLAVERAHAGAAASACAVAGARAEPPGDFVRACVDYLACVLAWFEERDQRGGDLLHGQRPQDAAMRGPLAQALAQPGRSREALEKLERAVAAGSAAAAAERLGLWQEFDRHFEKLWSTRRDAIDAVLAQTLRAAEWRTLAGIDADSILEERRRYARVRAALPAGMTLPDELPSPRQPAR
jgi:hypothetical protein